MPTPDSARRPLPLAELHCHLEGAVAPSLALKIGARHGMDLSGLIDASGGYRWSDFAEFIYAYDSMSEALRTADDYYEIAFAYLTENAARGLIYAEFFVSPEHAGRYGLTYEAMVDAVGQAMADAEAAAGVAARMILTCVRHYGVDHAEATARLAVAYPHPRVTGFGIAGDEAKGAHADFARAFAIAKHEAGLRTTAHAGELLGPDSVRAALRDLDVERIGHGVRAIEDPALVAELAARGVPLELCPSSSVAIGLYPVIASHPVARLTQAGVTVTLSTDDPAFFGDGIAAEYAAVGAAHGFEAADLLQFTAAAVEAAFCDDATKAALRARLADWRAKSR